MTAETVNFLLQESSLPYGLPRFDRMDSADFRAAFDSALASHQREVAVIADLQEAPSFDNTIVALDVAGQDLHRLQLMFQGLASAHTNDTLQAIQSEMAPRLSAHHDAIQMNPALFRRIAALHQQREDLKLSTEQLRLLERYHLQFVRAGAGLDDAGQARLKAINAELSTLTTQFRQRVLAETNARALLLSDEAELAGLPRDAREAAREAAKALGKDGWALTLVLPTGQPALQLLENASVRRRLFEASSGRGQSGEHATLDLIAPIVRLRAERARLLGYATHADYVLEDRTAGSYAAVQKMLARIVPAAVRNARAEAAAIAQQLRADGQNDEVHPWDWAYYSERVRKAQYDFDMAALKPYLSLERVLKDGAFYAAAELYGLSFTERTDLPVYHPDVRVFECFRDGRAFGLFLFDPYARPTKQGGAWMSSYVDQSTLLGTAPVVANHLNIPRPADGRPALLTFEEVETLFHEFGHALHGLLSEVEYPYFSGLNVPWDFVEFPSQVNEFWSTWPEVLTRFARHVDTNEPLPRDLMDKFLATRTFNEGFATTEYLSAVALDLAWHNLGPDQVPEDIMAFEAAALESAGLALPFVPPRYRTPYFAHVFAGDSYAAGYYSYIWSEVLDADAAQWFVDNGGLSRENGERLARTVLSRGGSQDALTMYREFRGQDAEIEPLLRRRGLAA